MKTTMQPTPEPAPESYPWGIAHSRRGLKFHLIAKDFIEENPKGTVFEGDELVKAGKVYFYAHLEKGGYYPPSYFARKLTISGTHPRMGKDVFAVVLTPEGTYRVLDPIEGWQTFDLGDTLEKKIQSLLRFHNYKLQSKHFFELPAPVQKCIRRVYREYQRTQEFTAILHTPILEALQDLAEELENSKE